MRAFQALGIMAILTAAATAAAAGGPVTHRLLGMYLPYTALAVFAVGMIARVICWARSPVPFKITVVCGQQRSLPFLRHQPLESPFTGWQTLARMALEILLFRSLFRNTSTELRPSKNLSYDSDKLLWAAALAFHWSFLVVLLRHLRFFLHPVPEAVILLENLDGFFQVLLPVLYLTDIALAGALLYLLARRLLGNRLRYISLPADYFVLFLLLAIAGTGIGMRYIWKTDLVAIKELTMGLVTLNPVIPSGIGMVFFLHLFFVCALCIYFPFSKLVHMGGVFLSPGRNMANNNRARRHVNPWDRPVDVHTYAQWEEEFHDKLKACGLPVEGE